MAELSAEQKRIIRMIEKEAEAAGVDPDFAVALANLESGFKHIPAHDKKSTSFGPFQVNKATAEANGVDYDEMKKNPELAVRAGILNIARHARNPDLMSVNPETGEKEVDPLRVAAAHRLGENSEYAKTGDPSKIDKVLAGYLADAMEHFPNQEFPGTIYSAKKTSEEKPDMGSIPLGGATASEQTREQDAQEASDRRLGAAIGAGTGTFLGAVKAPVWSTGKRVYDFLRNVRQGDVTPQDVADVAEATARVRAQNAQPGATTPATPESTGPYSKYTRTFGQNLGLTEREIAESKGMGKGEGEAWDIVKKAKEANKKIANLYGEGYALDPQSQLLLDTSAGSGPRGQTRSVTQLSPTAEQKAQAVIDYQNWVASQNMPKAPDAATRVARTVLGSTPVRWGLGGMGVGYNLEDAYQNFMQPGALNKAAGTTALGGATASALGMVPKYAARANPAAIALTTGAQMMGDISRGDRQAAAESGLTGATALLPRFFGPLSAALYSRGLNQGEQEELERRRKLPPTITRP